MDTGGRSPIRLSLKYRWERFTAMLFVVNLIAAPVAARGFADIDDHSIIDRESREIDLDHLGKVHLLTEQYRFNMANYIPLRGLPERDNGERIARRILKQTVQTVFDKYEDSPKPLVRRTGKANAKMKANVRFSNQKVGFRLRLFEAVSEVNFSGPIEGRIAYEIAENEVIAELAKSYSGRRYIYSHVRDSDQYTDMFIVRWSF